MNSSVLTDILIGVVIFGWLMWRQLSTRAVKTDRGNRGMIIMGVIGIWQVVSYVNKGHHIGAISIAGLVVSLVVAAGLSAVRGSTVKLWRDDAGAWWRRGTPLTLVLWVVSIGTHLGIDAVASHFATNHGESGAAGLGTTTIVLYLAVSLGLQRVVIDRRIAATTASR